VILTSSKEESDINAGYDYGANSFVVKPIRRDDFEKAIENLGLYWLIVNQSPPLTKK
jgi:two-component system response regulator